ncbi:glycosyl hydrolase family 95 catalytic domain-containing protein [Arthrobacter russicus]|uniref:Alpha-L-fucosidase 2 n=1 Tax=Arthrobacter russicus TaxID=172040 RepID=A0ABU1JDG3_9MICC|nr:glycoside hydrolase N-terminal domain-containing protein [Arthrobacter russicus]MDR6270473.1 alpha-L-fucosidase 2 [Arthrobacter russicus]
MNRQIPLSRRRVLQLGGALATTPVLLESAAQQAGAASRGLPGQTGPAAPPDSAKLSAKSLWYRLPATDWQSQALPIGNGRVGGMIFGSPEEDVVQFNEISLWGGVNNYDNALAGKPDSDYDTSVTGFGSYRDFGQLNVTFAARKRPVISTPGGPYTTSDSETAAAASDGKANTKWCIVGPPREVLWQIQFPEPTVLAGYALTSANDVPARDPQDWTLQGSADGSAWTVLDSRAIGPFESRGLEKRFSFGNTTGYAFYRFVFVPKAGVSHFQVAEITVPGMNPGAFTSYISCPSESSAESAGATGVLRSVDNDPATSWQVPAPGAGAQWQLDLATPAVVNSYTLTSADAADSDPRSWKLEGSEDGAVWTVLDTRQSGSPFQARNESKTFAVSNTKAYPAYRLTLATSSANTPLKLAAVKVSGPGFDSQSGAVVVGYQRALDLAVGVHSTRFGSVAGQVLREAFVSQVDDVMVLRYTSNAAGGLSGTISLKSAQTQASTSADVTAKQLAFRGNMANNLKHAATVRVVESDGTVTAKDNTLQFSGATKLTLLLDARTDYAMNATAGWRGADPAPGIAIALNKAALKGYSALLADHRQRVSALMDRATVAWGDSEQSVLALPTGARLKRYAAGGADPTLEQIMFDFSRYLLLSSSRADGLPANLQGLWNNSNQPAWASDYHTNINVQMNYWGAETTNLSESHLALAKFVAQVAVPSRVATRNAFGSQVRGWTARTSQSVFGGNSWEWNTVASAWYAQHLYEHWAFSQDIAYLRDLAYPIIKEICQFWQDRLKVRADGSLVSPNGWSPEQGPKEDGVMYDQQIIWDLFQNYLDSAKALNVDAEYQTVIAGLQSRLAQNKIGRWGQLQEWQEDRDDPNNIHRHTSHLFAVYPGRQITPKNSEFSAAALVSLKARCGEKAGVPFTAATVSGDSRRSWTWPWRAALFARLGDGFRAQQMFRGLLSYNTLPNLFASHPPFQIDGNLGISGAVAEMLLQSHAGFIHLLPACPEEWRKSGSFTGLRARGGYQVDCSWTDGQVVSYRIVADRALDKGPVTVRVNGQDVSVIPVGGKKETPPKVLFLDGDGVQLAPGSEVKPGQLVTVMVSEARTGLDAVLELRSTPVRLAAGKIDGTGGIVLNGQIPAASGSHRLVLTIAGVETASLAVSVKAAATETGNSTNDGAGNDPVNGTTLPNTGLGFSASGVLAAAGATVAAGSAAVAMSKNRE